MGYLYRAPQGMGDKTQKYQSWQGPVLSAQDRLAYQNYCKDCIDIWDATPAPFETWWQSTNGISVPVFSGYLTRSFSTLNTK